MNGKIQVETISSVVLKGNPLGDPRRREVPVYIPAAFGSRRLPVIYFLTGFTGTGRACVNVKLWKENPAERFDRLIAEGKAKPAIMVFPDCSTAYGGSQYVNSPATGRYEDHVVQELVPFIEDKFAAVKSPSARLVMGQSSGGFGALWLAMRNPGVFGHAASHSGDMLFEQCYALDFPKFVNALHAHGGSPRRFVKAFLASRDKEGFDHAAINTIGMASCYSPNPKSKLGFDLPCDPRTGEPVAEVMERWKAFDPVEACAHHRAALRSLSTLYVDAGRKDEFFLHLGARKLADRLKSLGVKHVHEEHDRGHFDMSFRYERSLGLITPKLR